MLRYPLNVQQGCTSVVPLVGRIHLLEANPRKEIDHAAADLRSANRSQLGSDKRFTDVGFRVVREMSN